MSMDNSTNNNDGQAVANEPDLTRGFSSADTEGNETADPILTKHLDIAIEAQDGPKNKNTENKGTEKGEKSDKQPEGTDGTKKDGESGADNNAAQSKPKQEGKEEKREAPGPKDLVLKGQGENGTDLVIKGGAERRFYEQRNIAVQRAEAAEARATRIENELVRAQQQIETVQNSIREVNGLPPDRVAGAVRLYSDLQRDPSGTLKKLLAEAVAMGHTVEGIQTGVDSLALQRMLDERLANLGANNNQGQQSDEALQREAEVEVAEFFRQHADARPHEQVIAAVLRDHPDLSLEAAYFQLRDAFAQRGYDWSRTLDENVREQAAANGGQSQEQPHNNGTKKPVPTGGGSIEPDNKSETVVMSENADTGDIVRAAMREAGMNI